MSEHHCHAIGCEIPVPPKMFTCRRHWYMLPKAMRDEIWENYRPGQEIDKSPTGAYLVAACKARMYLAEKEGKTDHRDYAWCARVVREAQEQAGTETPSKPAFSPLYKKQIEDLRVWFQEKLKPLPEIRMSRAQYQTGFDAIENETVKALIAEAFNIWLNDKKYELSYNQMNQGFFWALTDLQKLNITEQPTLF